MSGPTACDECLRRSQLLALLAPFIEKVATRQPGSRSGELLRLSNEDLAHAVAPAKTGELLAEARASDPARMRKEMEAAGCWACCRHEDAYPAWLRDSAEAPAALIARGNPRLLLDLEQEAVVTIVGARRASRYGAGVARQLGRDLAVAGLTVISGMAYGIDSAAHDGALEAGGRTIAVLGSGPDVPYPPRRRALYERIVVAGLVLSEFPPGMTPWKWMFPARNRIMAAMACMTIVVEAAPRSGSLITAEMAADLGRHVGAVPGQVTSWLSAGTNALLHEGAHVIRDAQDALDAVLGPGRAAVARHGPSLNDELLAIVEAVSDDGAGSDAIAVATGLPAGRTAAALAELELLGYLRGDSLGRYTRTMQEAPPKLSA